MQCKPHKVRQQDVLLSAVGLFFVRLSHYLCPLVFIGVHPGLEYLHKGCKPPLVHRDVKTGNILLSESLEAKIADFGLSKAFQSEINNTHVSTVVMGTPGYLDPEYAAVVTSLIQRKDRTERVL